MKCIIFILLVIFEASYSVIYKLNGETRPMLDVGIDVGTKATPALVPRPHAASDDTEYLRMPPIYHLDDYDSCIHETNGTYCYTDMDLVSDTPSNLLQMIHEYSEHNSTHFNHTQLHYGICLTKTCRLLLKQNKTEDTALILERCLNESLWRDFRLKVRLANTISCKNLDDPMIINVEDIIAGVIFGCILLLNAIGSLYDFYFTKGSKGNKILLSFSLKRNLEKLFSHEHKDPHKERLKGIHGLRTLAIILVILVHAPFPIIIGTENPHGLEQTYDNMAFHILYNGTLIIQLFFIITGCLLAYNVKMYSETNELSWVLIPKGLMLRWLRLTPAYAVVLIFTLTWIRSIGSGPMWEKAVGVEVADCHRDGWLNMIYLNSYIDNSQCMAQTWYLASDMQLYVLGLIVCILAKTSKRRKIVLSALFIIGVLIPAIQTYVQDLDAVMLITPEVARNVFVKYSTFNNSYKRGHTNIPGFVIGLALGNLIYEGLRDESKMKKYKNLGFLYYLTVPLGALLILSGMVFYGDRPRPSIYVRTILAAVYRPLFALIVAIFFIGMVFKYENLYRPIIEWRGWRVAARVSYSAFLLHISIIRIFAGMNTTLSLMGLFQCLKEAFGIIFISFLMAYPFWLFVEAPLNEAVMNILGLTKMKNDNGNLKKDVNHEEDSNGKAIDLGTATEVFDNKHLECNVRL